MKISKITIGEIISIYGLKGWFKVRSYTDRTEDILKFANVFLSNDENSIPVKIDKSKSHNKGFLIHVDGIDDPDQANLYRNYKIQVEEKTLPSLKKNEFYWHQLEGLQVINNYQKPHDFGKVDFIFETGANDVLVVKRENKKDILVPYLLGDVVKDIDLDKGIMTINWFYED